jgi:hypothetical protein
LGALSLAFHCKRQSSLLHDVDNGCFGGPCFRGLAHGCLSLHSRELATKDFALGCCEVLSKGPLFVGEAGAVAAMLGDGEDKRGKKDEKNKKRAHFFLSLLNINYIFNFQPFQKSKVSIAAPKPILFTFIDPLPTMRL